MDVGHRRSAAGEVGAWLLPLNATAFRAKIQRMRPPDNFVFAIRSDLARCAMALVITMGLASCDKRPDDRPIAYRGEYHYDKDTAYLVQAGVDAKICVQGADMAPAIQPEFAAAGGVSEVVVRV